VLGGGGGGDGGLQLAIQMGEIPAKFYADKSGGLIPKPGAVCVPWQPGHDSGCGDSAYIYLQASHQGE
jgi:hypothetical protein